MSASPLPAAPGPSKELEIRIAPQNEGPRPYPIKSAGTKLKLKLDSQDKSQNAIGYDTYLQGYDRELDSDREEPLVFEEHFILKLSPGPECDKLRELTDKRREIDSSQENVYMKFKDSRRGVFSMGEKMFGMKLVDLPCVIEAQKTFDNRHVFKVADICQMVVVDDTPITDESAVTQGNFNIEDFIYPHGMTPPLHHVRKRRFRKRLNKRTIETVERAVERLLEEDSRSDQVIIDIVDNIRDLSDSEGEDYQPPSSAQIGSSAPGSKVVYNKPRPSSSANKQGPSQPLGANSHTRERAEKSKIHGQEDTDGSQRHHAGETPLAESLDGQTPAGGGEEFEEQKMMDYDQDEGSIDSDLAAEIEAGLMEGAAAEERAAAGLPEREDGDEDDSEDLFGNGEDEDEDDDDDDEDDDDEETDQMVEYKQRVRLLQGELKDLEAAINRKKGEITKAANIILKRRFEEALKKLNIELESKKTQLNSTLLTLQNAAKERTVQREKEQERLDEQPSSGPASAGEGAEHASQATPDMGEAVRELETSTQEISQSHNASTVEERVASCNLKEDTQEGEGRALAKTNMDDTL